MDYCDDARLIGAEDLKKIIENKADTPTIDRLMFIEVRKKDDKPGQLFPCYAEAWGEDKDAVMKTNPGLRFQFAINQYMGGEFQMVRVIILASELGLTKRIWSAPPSDYRSRMCEWAPIEGGIS